jgi:hypothetical protein
MCSFKKSVRCSGRRRTAVPIGGRVVLDDARSRHTAKRFNVIVDVKRHMRTGPLRRCVSGSSTCVSATTDRCEECRAVQPIDLQHAASGGPKPGAINSGFRSASVRAPSAASAAAAHATARKVRSVEVSCCHLLFADVLSCRQYGQADEKAISALADSGHSGFRFEGRNFPISETAYACIRLFHAASRGIRARNRMEWTYQAICLAKPHQISVSKHALR